MVTVTQDEGHRKSVTDKIPSLKPRVQKDGTITAAASSSINDGAAALVLMRQSTARRWAASRWPKSSPTPRTRKSPEWFTTAPVGATEKALKSGGRWKTWIGEINEAFAVVPMALMHDLKVPHDKVNVNGGACALGHLIGASGARILVTLLYALQARGKNQRPRCALAVARPRPAIRVGVTLHLAAPARGAVPGGNKGAARCGVSQPRAQRNG